MLFQNPIAFLLLPLFFFLLWLKSRKKETIGFPNLTTLKEKEPKVSWLKKKLIRLERNLVPLLKIVVISIFVVALANPLYSIDKVRKVKETRLILHVQDASGSMTPGYRGNMYSRSLSCKSDVAIDGAKRFMELRSDDYMALIAFASNARLITPGFTTDYNLIKKKLEDIRWNTRYTRDMELGGSTEAGEALWLSLSLFLNYLPREERPSVSELMDMRDSLISSEGSEDFYIPPSLREKDFGKGKIVILYTDAEFEYYASSSERLNVLKLVRLLRHFGIKIYLLLADTSPERIDVRLINAITLAENKEELKTAGKVFPLKGDDLSGVNTVFDQINELEKTELVLENYDETKGLRHVSTLVGIFFLLGYMFLKYHNRFRKPEL